MAWSPPKLNSSVFLGWCPRSLDTSGVLAPYCSLNRIWTPCLLGGYFLFSCSLDIFRGSLSAVVEFLACFQEHLSLFVEFQQAVSNCFLSVSEALGAQVGVYFEVGFLYQVRPWFPLACGAFLSYARGDGRRGRTVTCDLLGLACAETAPLQL